MLLAHPYGRRLIMDLQFRNHPVRHSLWAAPKDPTGRPSQAEGEGDPTPQRPQNPNRPGTTERPERSRDQEIDPDQEDLPATAEYGKKRGDRETL
jgi:hypothetical protein